jgi:hypothetical protein
VFYSGSALPNVGGEFTLGQPPRTLPKLRPAKKTTEERGSCLQIRRNTELAEKPRSLLEENKEANSWGVDTHTCQLKQQEAKVERQGRGEN